MIQHDDTDCTILVQSDRRIAARRIVFLARSALDHGLWFENHRMHREGDAEREKFCREREILAERTEAALVRTLAVMGEREKQIPHGAKGAPFGMTPGEMA